MTKFKESINDNNEIDHEKDWAGAVLICRLIFGLTVATIIGLFLWV